MCVREIVSGWLQINTLVEGSATAICQEKDKNVNTLERERWDRHLQMACPSTPKSQSIVFKILGHSLSSEGFQIYDQQTKFIAFVCISNEHRVTELTDECLVNLTQLSRGSLGRRKLDWENSSFRSGCGQAYEAFSRFMIDVAGSSPLRQCHSGQVVLNCVLKQAEQALGGEASKQHSSTTSGSASTSKFLPYTPASTSFCDKLRCGTITWNKLFPPLIAFGYGVYHSDGHPS